jgi:CDP-paratose 2-epimerase
MIAKNNEKKYLVSGIGISSFGVGRFIKHLDYLNDGTVFIIKWKYIEAIRINKRNKKFLKLFFYSILQSILIVKFYLLLFVIKNKEIIIIHPQTIGWKLTLRLIKRNKIKWYLIDNSFFCLKSYNYRSKVGECLDCIDSAENCAEAVIIYSSTNKVYGDMDQYGYIEKENRYVCKEFPEGFDEEVTLNFSSPYGCSKGAADQYMLDYHKMFGLRTVVFRHSSIFGGSQFSTFDQGWVGWFVQQAIKQSQSDSHPDFTVSGNGKQVRDLLFVDDAIQCYLSAYEQIETTQGKAYNIGGGYDNSLSILELFEFLENKFLTKLRYRHIEKRVSDQKVFIAQTKNIEIATSWKVKVDKKEGLDKMCDWISFKIKAD